MATAAPPATNKKANTAAKKGKDGKKKGKAGLIILLVFIVVVLGAVLMTAFNVFGLRDDVVVPMLRNVPLVRNLIPPDPDAELTLAQINEELEEAIRILEAQLAGVKAANDELTANLELIERALNTNDLELVRLREIEAGQVAFANRRAQFEREVAEGNESVFVAWFEAMNPDLAERIYRSIVVARVDEERWQNFVNIWGAMNPRDVAHAIETMITTDMDMIVAVLAALPHRTTAAINGALTIESRGAILRHLDPR